MTVTKSVKFFTMFALPWKKAAATDMRLCPNHGQGSLSTPLPDKVKQISPYSIGHKLKNSIPAPSFSGTEARRRLRNRNPRIFLSGRERCGGAAAARCRAAARRGKQRLFVQCLDSGSGHIGILLHGTAAHADGSDNNAILVLQQLAAAKDDQTTVRHLNTKKLLTGL